jgi:hypothetical protein
MESVGCPEMADQISAGKYLCDSQQKNGSSVIPYAAIALSVSGSVPLVTSRLYMQLFAGSYPPDAAAHSAPDMQLTRKSFEHRGVHPPPPTKSAHSVSLWPVHVTNGLSEHRKSQDPALAFGPQ